MLYGIRIKNKDNSKILKNEWKKDIMTMSESELRKFIEHNISQGKYFSCVVLYEKNEILAWHAALRIGEIITEYFKAIKGKQIKIHLNLNIATIVSQLNEMKHDDILLLNIIDQNFKAITSYLSREVLLEKRNIIFISMEENPLIKQFMDITYTVIKVNTSSQGEISCAILISNRGERELKLSQPNSSFIEKFRNLRMILLKESIRKQVPELEDKE